MRITTVTLSKAAKIGLPKFSNITIGCSVTWELKEGEDFDFLKGYDLINQQIDIQADNGTDPSWISQGETKGNYKTVIRTPKIKISKDDTDSN